ncbi:MAG TPA: copper resistance protein NlpE N-terminal domain-containing protein [Luteimonas sp.]|jgi:hypothetical protein|nr:copper resistance protein NlpE N-terminal domain-containing protein [Luteimonas sp.]
MSVAIALVPPSRALRLGACLLAASLAGCHGKPPPQATAAQARLDVDGEIQWRGAWPCADCDGIDAQLVLRRAGDRNTYSLAETYRLSGQGARFVETGRWQREGALLRLRGDGASMRVYALLADGRLEARDLHGAPLAQASAAPMLPVSATETR